MPRTDATEFGLLPTPSKAAADGGQTSRSGDRKDELLLGGIAKAMDAGMYHTPQAHDAKKGNAERYKRHGTTHGGADLNDQVAAMEAGLWPTPTANGNHNRAGLSPTSGDGLATAVNKVLWPTPTASEGTGAQPNTGRTGGKSPREAVMLPPPTATMYKGSSPAAMHPTMDEGAAKGRGQASADQRHRLGGSLNPTWVEWLMGYPEGWTDLKD